MQVGEGGPAGTDLECDLGPEPTACVVTSKDGGLPTPANLAEGDGLTAECVMSRVEIDRLAAFEAEAIRVHVRREPGEKARATSVKAIRR